MACTVAVETVIGEHYNEYVLLRADLQARPSCHVAVKSENSIAWIPMGVLPICGTRSASFGTKSLSTRTLG
jgi:hypothetical protein